MHITVEIVESAYNLLRATPPFKSWKLPDSEEVEFHVLRTKEHAGDHSFNGRKHIIRVSQGRQETLTVVLQTVGHEMVHMHQVIAFPEDQAIHGTFFLKCAKSVCKHHGWDFKAFVYG